MRKIQAAGQRAVESGGTEPSPRGGNRLLIVFSFAVFAIVGVVASLATGNWWLLAVALVAHAAATGTVLLMIGRRLAQAEKPDPVTEARLDDQGERLSEHEMSRGG